MSPIEPPPTDASTDEGNLTTHLQQLKKVHLLATQQHQEALEHLITLSQKSPQQPSTTPTSLTRNLLLHITEQSPHHFYRGFDEDITKGGLFVNTAHPLAIGTQVELYFTLAIATPQLFHCPSHVAWNLEGPVHSASEGDPHNIYGMALAFDAISDQAIEAIEIFFQEKEPLFYSHPQEAKNKYIQQSLSSS